MITKERLEELIEKGATILSYEVLSGIEIIDLKENGYKYEIGVVVADDIEHLLKTSISKYGKSIDDWWWFSELFETEEEAVFYKEFGCIERTERLELPTWEELFKEDRVLDCYTQEFGIVKNRSFIGVVLLGVDFTNEIVEVSIGSDQIFCELLTKENYTLACRKAKELFLGEKK